MPTYELFQSRIEEGKPTIRAFPQSVRRSSDQKRTTVTINTDSVDRHGTIIDPNGAELGNYERNPVFLINHDHDMVAGNGAVVQVQNGRIVAQVDDSMWDHEDPEIERWYNKVKNGFVRMASVGFVPKKIEWEDQDGNRLDNPIIRKWEMIEFSFVSVGSNPDALVTQRNSSMQHSRELEELRESIRQLEDLKELKDMFDELKRNSLSEERMKALLEEHFRSASAAPSGSDDEAREGESSAPDVPARYAAPRTQRMSGQDVAALVATELKRQMGKA